MDIVLSKLREKFAMMEDADDQLWYHGTNVFPKYLEVRFEVRNDYAPNPPQNVKNVDLIPEPFKTEFLEGKIASVYFTYEHSSDKIRISRTYQGRSNFGFGFYMTNDLERAKSYGQYIVVAAVSESVVVRDSWPNRLVPGTPMNFINSYVEKYGGESYRDQAPLWPKALRAFKRTAKALYVGEETGQLVVFSKQAIKPKLIIVYHGSNS